MTTTQTEDRRAVAARIREERRAAGLTQGGLAALVGVTAHTVWRWETGRRKPGPGRFSAVVSHCRTARTGKAKRPGAAVRERNAPARVVAPREARMRAVLGVIARYAAGEGYPPSMQEIMDETGFSSKSVVGYSLNACEEAGLIVRARGLARAVRLTEAGRAFAEAHSETGSLPVRREEIASSAPGAAAAPTAASDTTLPPVLQLRDYRSHPPERAR